jgi:hypothetical protein
VIVAGETPIVTIGATAAAFTVSVAALLAEPPAPVHVSVYVAVPVLAGVSVAVPLVACVPLHAPLAVHEVAFVDDHVSVAFPPRVIVAGETPIVTTGATAAAFTVSVAALLPEPPAPVHVSV